MEIKDLLKKYKEGIITLDELKDFAKNEETNQEEYDIDNALKNKLEREIQEFKEKLKLKSKDEIIDSAYELVTKEEIKNELLYMELHEIEKQFLFLQDDVIDEIYHDWLDIDVQLGDLIIPTIEDSIAVITRDYRKLCDDKEI